ncbi:MAG TPA: DMT family transporter [Labilithrix sp.]|nr:DMT family transporter [Labilithrix sp.]
MAALGLMALGALLFSLMNFLARIATASASWASVAAARATIGALVAFTIARMRGQSLTPNNVRSIFWRSLFGTVSMVSTFYALSSRTVSLGDTVTLLNLAPVFLAVLAPIFLRERTTAGVAFAIALALLGVMLVVRPTFLFGTTTSAHISLAHVGPSATATTSVAVFAALSTSIAMMLLRRVGQTESAETIAFHFSLFAALALSFLSLFDLRVPTSRDAACMVGAGLCAGFGQLAMTRAYALEHAARVSGMSYLSVVASALLGAAVLGERPGPTAVVGMGLVIAGGILVTFARSSEKPMR